MLDIGWTEMLVIAIVMIVVVGPKDLPRMLRTFGKTTAKMRSMAGDFRKQFDEAMKEADLEDLKGLADDARKLNPTSELKKAFNPMEKAAKDVRAGLDAAMNPKKPGQPEPTPAVAKANEPLKAGATAVPGEGKSEAAVPAKGANGASPARPAAAKAKPAKAASVRTTPVKAAVPKAASAKPASKPKAAAKSKNGGAAT
jgi:sec-independent protein translocase protein TatB